MASGKLFLFMASHESLYMFETHCVFNTFCLLQVLPSGHLEKWAQWPMKSPLQGLVNGHNSNRRSGSPEAWAKAAKGLGLHDLSKSMLLLTFVTKRKRTS